MDYEIPAFAGIGHRGRGARHRSAKPFTPVRIRTMPLKVKTSSYFNEEVFWFF